MKLVDVVHLGDDAYDDDGDVDRFDVVAIAFLVFLVLFHAEQLEIKNNFKCIKALVIGFNLSPSDPYTIMYPLLLGRIKKGFHKQQMTE